MTIPADNTPAAIISDAMEDAGLLQDGDSPDSEQIAKGMRRLRDLINVEQTQGIKLWLNVDTPITLVEDTGTYELGPVLLGGTVSMVKPLRVIDGYYLDSNEVRTPLIPLSWEEYLRLSQIDQSGAINSYFVNKKQLTLSVSLWLVPDATAATGTVHLLLQNQVTNFTNLTETMNFPIEWRMYLHWGLADELATGQPQAIMDRCAQKAQMYKDLLEGWDVEDASTRFTPDSRSQYVSGSFR